MRYGVMRCMAVLRHVKNEPCVDLPVGNLWTILLYMTYMIDVLENGAINLLEDMEKLKLIRLIPSSKRKTVQSRPQAPGGDFSDNPADAFGMWKDRNISLESIREKAWKHR